jgi:predicted peroxiredoxin
MNAHSNGRVIVGCTHGDEDPDRVAVSYLTASAALDQGEQVVMWLTSEGVRLSLRGHVDPIRAELDPPISRLHGQFIDKGGRFFVCPTASVSAGSPRANSWTMPSSRARRR